jgi:hypothetical protein
MNRQRLVLLIAVLLLFASSMWGIFSYPRQKTVAKLTYPVGSRATADRSRPTSARTGAREPDSRTLRLDLLENQPPFAEYRRNIFSPLFVDRETMLARQAAAAAAAEAARMAENMHKLPPAKPVPVPTGIQNELASFKFHGFLKKDGKKTVFLAKGSEITPLKQGSTFVGRFLVTSITDQVLILKVVGTDDEVIIPLIENDPLRAMW